MEDEKLSYSNLVEFFRNSASKGDYLTGDIFYVEAKNSVGKVMGGGARCND
jgi:hypothetical protein